MDKEKLDNKETENTNIDDINIDDTNIDKKKKIKEKKPKKTKSKYREELTEKEEKEFIRLLEELKKASENKDINIEPKILIQKESPKEIKKRRIIRFFISFIVLFALTGYINWMEYEKLIYAILSVIGIVVLESTLDFLVSKFFLKLMVYTLGIIRLLYAPLGFLLVGLFMPTITYPNIFLVIIVIMLYFLLRTVFMQILRKINERKAI